MKYQRLPYNQSLALLTDLYELTMSYGYWKAGVANRETVFHLFFRENPFKGGFALACGLDYAIDYLRNFSFDKTDLEYLSGLSAADGKPLFDKAFLNDLGTIEFQWDIDAVPEGTVVFAYEPLLRIQGPIIQCQLLESALLNIVNFQTLIATKAARVCRAAQGDPVLEFGLRRAQGIDGSLAASRAAFIGGCEATSNTLAGKIFGIPVRGTHAHSWVMSFDTELESFEAYARAMPNNCIFLVDTYDTPEGVRKAVQVGKWLRGQGHEMIGVRLDSGDLASLSIEARKILDKNGFSGAGIIASNELDEGMIEEMKARGSPVAVWGVGTKLVTGYDQPALGGVYKLSAVRTPPGAWDYKIKLSSEDYKISSPGLQQVKRFQKDGRNLQDMIYDIQTQATGDYVMIDPLNPGKETRMPRTTPSLDLLIPVFRKGKPVYSSPPLTEIRKNAANSLSGFDPELRKFSNPGSYPVGVEKSLFALKSQLVKKARETKN